MMLISLVKPCIIKVRDHCNEFDKYRGPECII